MGEDKLTGLERRILLAVAEAAMPAGHGLPGADGRCVERLVSYADGDPLLLGLFRGLLWTVQGAAVASRGLPFSMLPRRTRERLLERWVQAPFPWGLVVRQLVSGLRISHLSDESVHARFGCRYAPEPVVEARPPRWMDNVRHLPDQHGDLELDAEVVVVGTGAGGAVVARELAARGCAVVMLEEGEYHRRPQLAGPAMEKVSRLYRGGGMTAALGHPPVMVQTGVGVGGTTLINSGTCYRTPDRVLRRWREERGLTELTPAAMAPYLDRVERVLQVEPVPPELLSGAALAVARGAEALRWRHGPLQRNAPGCDKQAHCAYGCPSDAKRSTNVSYVPAALADAATLVTGARAVRVVARGGRAAGVEALASTRSADGRRRRLIVRAPLVVVACGSLQTPVLLQRSGVRSPALGRNLTVHPVAAVFADLEEKARGWDGVPQSYAIEEFLEEGVMMEDGFPRLELAPLALQLGGRRFMEVMTRFDHLAMFGGLVTDTGRGRVRPGPKPGVPLVTYHLHEDDVARLLRVKLLLARLFFAAGARTVFTGLPGLPELKGKADVERLRRGRFGRRDLDLIGFHPLGTAALGADPATSVVRADHRVHDIEGLYVVDGAAVPGPLGVNPQVTIMALATRAAEAIADEVA